MDDAFLLSKKFIEQLKVVIRRVLAEMSSTEARQRRVYESGVEWQGITTSVLNQPTNGWTNPTTCTFLAYEIDSTSVTTPKTMVASTLPQFTIVNRDTTLSVPHSTYVRVKKIDGDWTIVWVAC